MNFEELLNEEQLKPVNCTEGPVLVLAGAGSGKTRVLTYRIANLIQKGVSPYNILAITFTNKAANEMKERIEKVTGCTGIQISTFHSFCAKVLRQDIEAMGVYTRNFTIYDDEDSDKIITRIAKEYLTENDDVKSLVKLVKSHISNAKMFGHSSTSYGRVISSIEYCDLITKVFADYEQLLVDNNALDFDDLLIMTVRLFHDHKDVLEKYQERYKYIHVDEFQDTNKIQYILLQMLSCKYYNIFVVGDDDQSIYGWRGAEVENIRRFQTQFMGCHVFKLQRNYRSTKSILDIANKIIANNKERMGKTLWTDGSEGVKVVCKSNYDERAEADFVLDQVLGLKKYNGYENKDFAILVRASSITRAFEEKLNLYNIPYRLIGGHKFYERKEIKDFLAYMKFISNPQDTESILRVINVPKRGIGDGVIEKLSDACKKANLGLFEAIQKVELLDLPNTAKNRIRNFTEIVNELYENRLMPLDKYVDKINEIVDFNQMYDVNDVEDKNRLENISDLIASVKEYVKDNPKCTIDEYLQSVSLIARDDKEEGSDDLLTIATVHGVKGLEYRCVFIVGLEEGLFPSVRPDSSEAQIEEERRIMYVAVTRAKERLYLTYTNQRFRFGQTILNAPSTFLKESGLLKTSINNVDDYIPKTKTARFDFSRKPLPTIQRTERVPSFNTSSTTSNNGNMIEKDTSIFKVGQKVSHSRFGLGVIIAIEGENGDIKFEGLGVKKFNLRLAPITVAEN